MWVFVAANVEEYMKNPSIVAKNIEKVDEPADLSDYIPIYDDSATKTNASRCDDVRAELAAVEKRTGNSFAGLLVDEVYKNSTLFAKFVVAPGSGRPHYGKRGGLIANTVRMAEAALRGAESYGLNDYERTVLIAAALMSRIGAIEAFDFKDCMPTVTNKGILLGINNLTMTRITSALKRVVTTVTAAGGTIDLDMVLRILHAVTSHDGTGVKPATREALVLNAAFQADAQIVDAMDFIEADTNVYEEFTAWDPSMGRKYYTGIRA
jgi:23S rRNA maturation-related 3'-5' exoribonuclease YhaM